MSIEGVRVVRGPDWHNGDDDGGEGYVGTVTQDNKDNTVEVQWDMGNDGCYNTGNGGKCELRVLDSCPAGLKHNDISCDSCSKKSFTGTRWKCQTCEDFDLCNVCYTGYKHVLQHPFLRISVPGGKGIPVSKRSGSKKIKPYGIFPEAKVRRGVNWNYGDQDGGEGEIGTVKVIKDYGSLGHERDSVDVEWPSNDGIYRVGYRGKVDLLCVEAAGDTEYYRDHLLVLDTRPEPKPGSTKSPLPLLPTLRRVKTIIPQLQPGDKVCLGLPEIALKEVQKGHGGWSMRMRDYIGCHGTVKSFEDNGDVLVTFAGKEYRLNACAVVKIPSLKVGDVVRIMDNERKVQAMQKSHGGWQSEMAALIGKVGKVVKIDSDGDVAVAFGEDAFVFNPACCMLAKGEKVSEVSVVESKPKPGGASGGNDDDDDDDDEGVDAAAALGHLIAKMFVLKELGKASVGPQHLVGAAAKNDINLVARILNDKPDLIDQKHEGLTALILSSHEGHVQIVQLLLKAGANTNVTEAKGNNALMAALMKKHEIIAVLIINAGVNIDAKNMFDRTALHYAATNGCLTILKMLLDRVADPNTQDEAGDTPLHDAICAKFTSGVETLLASSKINLKIINKKGHPPLHLAAMIDHESAVSLILKKYPDLVNSQKEDGFTPLHVAAINDNTDIIETLLKFEANVDARDKNNNTALHLAAHQGYLNSTKLLVQNGANVNVQDNDGDTPLHTCVTGTRHGNNGAVLAQLLLGVEVSNAGEINERTNLACFLIQNGGSVDIRNKRNRDVLRSCKNEKMTNALRMFAAKHCLEF
ncbi:hypothetical protein ACF0H5_020011 [Mactra antiquata]